MRPSLGFIAVLVCVAIVGCGEDGERSGDSKEFSEVCDAYLGLVAAFGAEEPPDFALDIAPRLDTLEADAPKSIEDDIAVMVAAGRTAESGDTAQFETAEFAAAKQSVDAFAYDECPADVRLEIAAADYSFSGLPASIKAGTVALQLTNNSTAGEAHEAVVLRLSDGVTATFAEVLALPEEEAMASASVLGATFAPDAERPGVGFFDLSPGSYAVVCFVPVGASEENPEGTGPPHFVQGMISEFVVE